MNASFDDIDRFIHSISGALAGDIIGLGMAVWGIGLACLILIGALCYVADWITGR